MPIPKIIHGQKVDARLFEAAKNLRRNMTLAEKLLWERLRGNRLHNYHFRRQQIIYGTIVDFYCHEVDLIIEVDGDIHKVQYEMDSVREEYLKQMGFQILRFKNEEVVKNIDHVLEVILSKIGANNSPSL